MFYFTSACSPPEPASSCWLLLYTTYMWDGRAERCCLTQAAEEAGSVCSCAWVCSYVYIWRFARNRHHRVTPFALYTTFVRRKDDNKRDEARFAKIRKVLRSGIFRKKTLLIILFGILWKYLPLGYRKLERKYVTFHFAKNRALKSIKVVLRHNRTELGSQQHQWSSGKLGFHCQNFFA